jgi:hypothetical protein
MSTLIGREELEPLIAEKNSAPSRTMPLKFGVCSPSDLLVNVTLVVRGEDAMPFRLHVELCCGFKWVIKCHDFPGCKAALDDILRDAVNKRPGAIHLHSPDEVIDEVMMYGEFNSGMVVACWTPEDYIRESRKPTEAFVRPYSIVDGKLCWLDELDGDAAKGFLESFLQAGGPSEGNLQKEEV